LIAVKYSVKFSIFSSKKKQGGIHKITTVNLNSLFLTKKLTLAKTLNNLKTIIVIIGVQSEVIKQVTYKQRRNKRFAC
jgi:hypothetical protein